MKLLKLTSLFFLLIAIVSCIDTKKEPGVLHGKRVMVLGNSITQNGAYVTYIEYFLRKQYPGKSLDIISIGLSSETVNGASEAGHPFPRPCIYSRIDTALALIQPDLVIVCYGMNDGLFSNFEESRFEAYKKGIKGLRQKIENTGADLILLTPTIFDAEISKHKVSYEGQEHSYKYPYYKYNDVLREFADWLISVKDKEFPVIDLHHYLNPIMDKVKQINPDSTFIPDGVHPNNGGHFLMAKKILNDLYPDIEVGEPYPTVNKLNSDSLYLLVKQRRKLRSKGWLEYVGYTRGKTVKTYDIIETMNRVKEFDMKIDAIQK